MPSRFSVAEASWQRGFASSSPSVGSAESEEDASDRTADDSSDEDIMAGHPCAVKKAMPRRRRADQAVKPRSPTHPMESSWRSPLEAAATARPASPERPAVPPHREELTPRPQHPLAALRFQEDAPAFAASDAMGSVCALNAIHRTRSRMNHPATTSVAVSAALGRPAPSSLSPERPLAASRAHRPVDDAGSPRGGFGTTPTTLRSQNRWARQRRFGIRDSELEDPLESGGDDASVCSSVLIATPPRQSASAASPRLGASPMAMAASSPDYFSADASPRVTDLDGGGQWARSGDVRSRGADAEPVSVSPTTTRGSTGPQASESGLPARWVMPPPAAANTGGREAVAASREAFWELPDNRSEVTSIGPTSVTARQLHPAPSKADRLKALLQHRPRTPQASQRPSVVPTAATATATPVASSSVSLGAMKALAAARGARSQATPKSTSRSTTPTATARFAQPTTSSRAKTEASDLPLHRAQATHGPASSPPQQLSEGASFRHGADDALMVTQPPPKHAAPESEDATRDPAVLKRFSVFCVATDRFGTGTLPRYVVNDTFAKAAGEAIDARSRARSPLTAASTNHSATGKPRLTASQRAAVFKLLQPALDDFVDAHGNVDYAGLVAHLHRGSAEGSSSSSSADAAPKISTQRQLTTLTPDRLVAHAAERRHADAADDTNAIRVAPTTTTTTTPEPSRRRRSLAELFLGNKRGMASQPSSAANAQESCTQGWGADGEFL